jgi:hypothetical protein
MDVRQEIHWLRRVFYWLTKMDSVSREYVAAWLLNTTQDKLNRAGFYARP